MSESFEKIKKRFWIEAIVKSAICGVSFGLLAAGAILLGMKLGEVQIAVGWYVLIAFGAFFVAGGAAFGVTFFILKPDDIKLAKKLDRKHGLNERVQTMAEYVGQDGAMLEMQRTDAENALKNLPTREITFKTIWQYVVIAVVSLAVFVTAVCLPLKQQEEGPVYVQVTDREKAEFSQLRADVLSSDLAEDLKNSYITVLDECWETLDGGVTEEQRKNVIISSVKLIDSLTDSANSYKKICARLIEVETLKSLSDGTVNAITLYRASGIAVKTYNEVKKRSENLVENMYEKYLADLTSGEGNLRSAFNVAKDAGLAETLKKYSGDITSCVANSGVDYDADAFTMAVKTFADGLAAVADTPAPDDTDEKLQGAIDTAFEKFGADASEALSVQSYNRIMDEFVREKLADIFKLSAEDLPKLIFGVEGGTSGEYSGEGDDDGKVNEGGMGSGEEKFGQDLIFVPEKGYVALKDVFDEYNSRMLNMLLDGSLTDEAAQIVHMYFRLLQERTGEEEQP